MTEVYKEIKDRLLKEGVVSLDALNALIQDQDRTGKHLFEVLVRSERIDQKKLSAFLAKTYRYPSINLATFLVEPSTLALVPRKFAEDNLLIPVNVHEKTLTIAFANPANIKIVDELRTMTGHRIKVVVAPATMITQHIEKYYTSAANAESGKAGNAPADEKQIQELAQEIIGKEKNETPVIAGENIIKIATETPVVKLVNMLLAESIRRKASDIFIEPWENHVRVRARVDGMLEEIIRPPKSSGPSVVSRIKVISGLDIAEHRIPQDGRFKIKLKEKEVDFRVSILPTSFGEKVCLRILDTSNQSHDISKLGFSEVEQQVIVDSARKPHGMILVTGPTGSGKTTTLYSVLEYLHSPEVNITTVEDPVEYQIEGINQVNVREDIGLTFPAALRSILRQDPDVILIGEIRDATTLDIAVKAALTGHLVLSTLHTNDAASSVTRMINMGLEPFLIASTVLMISAQRLVRRLCHRCRVPLDIDANTLKILGLDNMKGKTFYKPRGCSQCRQSGYAGRTVITEILPMTPDVRQLIMQGASSEAIKKFAHERNFNTLRECAIQKALAGETSLEEVFRVTGEDQGLKKTAEDDQNPGAAA